MLCARLMALSSVDVQCHSQMQSLLSDPDATYLEFSFAYLESAKLVIFINEQHSRENRAYSNHQTIHQFGSSSLS